MLCAFLVVGGLYSIGTNFYQIRGFREWIGSTLFSPRVKKNMRITDKTMSPFQTFATAMASSVGTGNIAGVATALVLGGPGAVFWMWISALLGMMTIFAENALGIKYRYKTTTGEWLGGAFIYIKQGLGMKLPATIYLIFCILASFGIGNAVQSNSVADALQYSFDVPPLFTGIVLTSISAIVIFGGMKSVARTNEKIVPFMIIGYILGGVYCIISNFSLLPEAIALIFKEALYPKSALGGTIGYGISRSMRYGIARGVFSNEAGIGTSALANSFTCDNDPIKQGMWGIFQVFTDTIVVCSITALAILTSGVFELGSTSITGTALASKSFTATLGSFGGIFVSISTIFFAFATIIAWSLFGSKCVDYLLGEKMASLYKKVYTLFIFWGAVSSLELVWQVTEALNGLMAIPNLIALILLSPQVFRMFKDYPRL
ncbi:MAG: sodium:alanine symporter family protein [Eubacteriales bacterium]|nr:sodium:alanine symporter family protein [Eubacteriales bacterium]